MVCPPRPYTPYQDGGYLIKDVKYHEGLFIPRPGYSKSTTLTKDNNIYDMVNNHMVTPFKVNKEVLDYLNRKGIEQNLLIDTDTEYEYEKLPTLRPLQKRKLVSYNTKKILQETIGGIADFYTKFSIFYFPVRLDQRGRLYCLPCYFNYPSSELSKALLQFVEPGIIKKTDKSSIQYFISYGVNCFVSIVAKQLLNKKLAWVEKNKENILSYENGYLLSKASDKFLAFCIEYKRYIEFMEDENMMEFHTYYQFS